MPASHRGNVASHARRALRGGLQRKNKKGGALFITRLLQANKFAAPFPQGNVASLRAASPAGGPTKKKANFSSWFYFCLFPLKQAWR